MKITDFLQVGSHTRAQSWTESVLYIQFNVPIFCGSIHIFIFTGTNRTYSNISAFSKMRHFPNSMVYHGLSSLTPRICSFYNTLWLSPFRTEYDETMFLYLLRKWQRRTSRVLYGLVIWPGVKLWKTFFFTLMPPQCETNAVLAHKGHGQQRSRRWSCLVGGQLPQRAGNATNGLLGKKRGVLDVSIINM